jgi:hypothetical protein
MSQIIFAQKKKKKKNRENTPQKQHLTCHGNKGTAKTAGSRASF